MASLGKNKNWRRDYNCLSTPALRDILYKANHVIPRGTRTDRFYLIETVAKIDRGILQYSRYPIHELRDFLTRRGIALQHPKPTKETLIKLLEEADNNLSLLRFLDLPRELRAMVYLHEMTSTVDEHHLAYGQRNRRLPSEPAIARVSSAIRSEVLHVYYTSLVFPIMGHSGLSGNTVQPKRAASMDLESFYFLRETDPAKIKLIKRFCFMYEYYARPQTTKHPNEISFKISIKDKAAPSYEMLMASIRETKRPSTYVYWRKAPDAVKASMVELADNAGSLTGPMLLRWYKNLMNTLMETPVSPHVSSQMYINVEFVQHSLKGSSP